MFLAGKYITKIYVIKYEQYVNRFIITMKYVLCTQITFTFLLSQSLWIQKPHNQSQFLAPGSLINPFSSPRKTLEVPFSEHRRKSGWMDRSYMQFLSHSGWDDLDRSSRNPACSVPAVPYFSIDKVAIHISETHLEHLISGDVLGMRAVIMWEDSRNILKKTFHKIPLSFQSWDSETCLKTHRDTGIPPVSDGREGWD